MRCSHCNEDKNIVWRDYAYGDRKAKPAFKGKGIGVCWVCLDSLGWKTEIKEILPSIKKGCGKLISNHYGCSIYCENLLLCNECKAKYDAL